MPIVTIDFETKDIMCTTDCEEWLVNYKKMVNNQRAIVVRYAFVAFLMLSIWLLGIRSTGNGIPLLFQTGLFICILRDIWVDKEPTNCLDSVVILTGFLLMAGLVLTLLGYM